MEIARLHLVQPVNVSIDIRAHDNFVMDREFAEESMQRVKEATYISSKPVLLHGW
jgi:hypothetical protein